ncbi:phospholipase D family protein [Lignipirellula cremea]|uniref:phospholipase D family protein n=1 Tax=Lignipirellula cremea TaxID=2528010 RepID=UPI0011A24502|nr:phospholipase D family protein [Lignipirellula cremea]
MLMESLQPPEGCRLDWAVGTTYTLDLMALLTAPVAFAFADWQDRDGRPTCDPLALLKAVRQYASQVCLFCQAGKIQVPKTYQPLLASLEESIVEANAPQGGSFHPKMWFLRFVDTDTGTVQYRVLCVSRNMTFDRSWDTLLCLEGPLRDRTNAFSRNHPLGQFVEALPGMGVRPLATQWKKRISQLAYEIRRVEFEIPEPFEKLEFWPLGIGGTSRWPFPKRVDRLFIVSPFVGDGLMEDLQQWQAPTQLLSRAESLERLAPTTLASLEKVWVLDDTANPEPGEAEEEFEADSELPEGGEKAQDIPLVGLHAKVYLAEEGWDARVFTGSANATRAAFGRNVEFLVELRGKRSRCGIAAMLGESSEGEQKRASCLADLLQPYNPVGSEVKVDHAVEAFERQVEQLAKTLAATAPVAQCQPALEDGSFRLRLAATKPLKKLQLEGFEVRARPVSLPSSQFYAVDVLESPWVEFAAVSLLGLTSFFVFEVESVVLKVRRQFVLNVPLKNAPENRHEAILRDLLSDRDRVLRFLMMLLLDTGARDLSKFMESSNKGENNFSFMHSLFGATLFESLVRALDRDPERLEQVAQVILDLRQTEDGKTLLPDDLDAIWEPIWAVCSQQLNRKKKAR